LVWFEEYIEEDITKEEQEMAFHFRCARGERREGSTIPVWLELIRQSDPEIWEDIRLDTEFNCDVELAELYRGARVLFRRDGTVSVVTENEEAAESLENTRKELGL
jgi:hypothetical protein